MKIICWNVQGAKKPQLRQEVSFINRTINPDILILLETMVNCQNTDRLIRHLGFTHFATVPTDNHVGGIWFLWNTVNVDVNILFMDLRFVHCLVHDKLTAKQC